jgi:MFS family permease
MLKLPRKDYLESLKIIVGLVQTISIVTGVLIAFFYCVGEKIVPSGLSLGDVFFIIIIIALGFGTVMIVGSIYGVVAALLPVRCVFWLVRRLDRKSNHQLEVIPSFQGKFAGVVSFFILLIFLMLIYAAHIKDGRDFSAARTFGFFPIFGVFLLLLFCTRWPGEQVSALLPRIGLATVLLGGIIATVHPALLNLTMTTIGIRSASNALIVVGNAEHTRLEEFAKQNSLDIRFCPLPGSDSWGTRDVRAIWHGIGATSYVQLLDRATGGQRNLRVPVSQDHLAVIGAEGDAPICRL